ncbi:MAG: ABC transporter permease [bacterium]
MQNIWAIYKREMRAYFITPMAYALYVIFLILSGYFFFALVRVYAEQSMVAMQQRQYGMTLPAFTEFVFRNLFGNMSIILLLMIPLLTMRLFAEEKKMGTMELLLTYPIRDLEVILGKFFAALSVVILMLAFTFLYPLLGRYIAGSQVEYGAIISGYLGLLLMATCFISVGVFLSSLTENQIVAAVVSFGVLLLFWVIGWAEQLTQGIIAAVLKQVSILNHFDDFSKGVIDTGHLSYYLLFGIFFIFLTLRVLDSNKWRG